jgi:transcription antitermination factor NusG
LEDWYAVLTSSRKEPLASARLQSVGMETFLPYQYEYRPYGDSWRQLSVPMFQGYVFVYGDVLALQQRISFWKDANLRTHIHGVLSSSTMQPLPIDNDFILEIKMNIDVIDDHYHPPQEAKIQPVVFNVDDEVWTKKDSGLGVQLAKIASLKSVDRARILLHILGANREVEIATKHLSKEFPE